MKLFYEIRSQRLFVGNICEEPFPLHVHAVVEIVHMLEGSIRLTVGDQAYTLHPGDTIAIFPSVVHSYDDVPRDAKGLCMIFVPDTIAEFAGTFRTMRPVDPFLPAEKLDSGMIEALEKLQALSMEENSPFLKCNLHVFLAHFLSLLKLSTLDNQLPTNLAQQVVQYVADHFDKPLTLESMSTALGVSRSHLSHLFSEQLNINFRKYINIMRVDQACTMLSETDMTVTEICYACGYNNPRTFHRAFIDECGVQPGEYRAKCRQKLLL